ncbi:putative BTB/POZ domain-containing protein 1 [Rhexocercosporidium sp. MPI-PUGE-AT-0058]|nr:putative BTB/POZ domain-containing protein 1 [Rhexocercosporidium sp. MPI-PUGE-AT-0058]
MSNLLWKFYHNEEVEKFRHLLSNGSQNTQYTPKSYGGLGNTQSWGSVTGSPGGFATSPRTTTKHRKASGQQGAGGTKALNAHLNRAEVNSRDHAGLTILHRAVSSTSEVATSFALALLEHPAIDLYAQDTENGWTALHRALYFGNITLARAIIEKDARDPIGPAGSVVQRAASSVIKVKDYEGNSPFDVYNATIARRSLTLDSNGDGSDDESDDGESMAGSTQESNPFSINGDEVFAWGSSRNHGLGFKDQDDRQHPEKIILKRPDHLLFRFYREYVESLEARDIPFNKPLLPPRSVSELPTLITNRPITIQDMELSKLHSAILTTDPESNLYMCGFGQGGRLGTGDETTRFSYVPIEEGALAGKKVSKIALGQNHSLAITSDGSLMSWGTNTYGQLGYTLPRPAVKDEEPICSTPRQIFGPLKREAIIGIAASALHSVAHTSTSLFTWGKNEGQLGLMDSDSRSLEVQPIPRKVAASLFKAAITMVSAINSATTVLLANHTVCVFTNYGYNIVKFPLFEGFSNYHLKTNALTTRYESTTNHISHITAGGDTIGAVSSRGDLFTVVVRSIPTNAATSTTNPAKIKDSLSTPERVWSLRKGHWDGIKSVGITENGSVIVCTQAGAVWRRIKRANIKDAFQGTKHFNRKDFKFQRIPGLTKVVSVRSTTFGVYAAIRKDCDVTKTQIVVDEQSLWSDVGLLLNIRDLKASEPPPDDEDTDTPRFWSPALPKDLFEPLKRAVLTSPDLEGDVSRHFFRKSLDDGYDVDIATSISEVRIPVHGFMLSRSPVFRKLMVDFRRTGSASIPDVLVILMTSDPLNAAKTKRPEIVFQGIDFITLINLAVYLYTDTVIDVWHFTRHCPKMAFRYRQVRAEVMKIASQLKLSKLEAAVRLMSEPDRQMNIDMAAALQDPTFFKDGDAIIELDGSEVLVHSSLLCQRCPFFEGLFNGRAGGQWLAERRQNNTEAVRIDLKHVQPETFRLVLRYIYSDVGNELFDDIVSSDIDEFSELLLDVLAVSDELMLDRLSQICQQVIGRFVNTRNACNLLNAIAPCAVTAFKDSALEYLCLQLESMLENHLLNDLDGELLLELDEVVRANQLNCLPFAKSGRADLLLHERHPSLAGDIHEERQRRIKEMTFRMNLKDDDHKLSSSYRGKVGSLDEFTPGSPNQEKLRRKSKTARNAPFSPSIRPKDSTIDLMFDMDDDEVLAAGSPPTPKEILDPTVNVGGDSAIRKISWAQPRSVPDEEELPSTPSGLGIQTPSENQGNGIKTWSSPALPSSKLDMREIMAQASSSRTSALSQSISAQKAQDEATNKQARLKLSQKERKKQQQIMQQSLDKPQISLSKEDGKPASPWQVAGLGQKTSLKDVLGDPNPSPGLAAKSLASPIPSQSSTPRRTASPDTRFAGQSRNGNSSNAKKGQSSSAGSSRPTIDSRFSKSSPIVPHSKSYTTPVGKAEPSLQLSMSDIIGQQRREQEVIKEAVAKRSLQEIQEEQAFQEWWDQESRRAQEQEAARSKTAPSTKGSKTGSGRGKSGSRGRGGKGRGDAAQRGRGRGQEKIAGAP